MQVLTKAAACASYYNFSGDWTDNDSGIRISRFTLRRRARRFHALHSITTMQIALYVILINARGFHAVRDCHAVGIIALPNPHLI